MSRVRQQGQQLDNAQEERPLITLRIRPARSMDTTVATTSASSPGSTTSCSAAIRSYSVVVMVAGAVSSPPDVAPVATLPSSWGPMIVRIVLPRFVLPSIRGGLVHLFLRGCATPPLPGKPSTAPGHV